MAKKKKRGVNNKRCDTHHLFWQRRKWNRGELKSLRLHPYCRVEIPKNTLHHQIHSEIKQIPTPHPRNAREAREHLNYLKNYGAIKETDSIEKRLRILISIFDYVEPRTAKALKKQLEIVYKYRQKPP